MTLHGIPAATELSGISFVTTEFAPITQCFPIETLPTITALVPIHEPSPITTLSFEEHLTPCLQIATMGLAYS